MDSDKREKLEKLVEEFVDTLLNGDDVKERIEKVQGLIKKGSESPCKIHITNTGNGIDVAIEGHRLGLVVTFASAFNNVLKTIKCSEEEFEAFKNVLSNMIEEEKR